MNTNLLVGKIIKAISFKYREDKTSPGLTISALKQGYYCSIIRYDGPFGNSKVVLCKSQADTLEKALKDVAVQFLQIDNQSQNPIQELSQLVWNYNEGSQL